MRGVGRGVGVGGGMWRINRRSLASTSIISFFMYCTSQLHSGQRLRKVKKEAGGGGWGGGGRGGRGESERERREGAVQTSRKPSESLNVQ